MIKHLIRCLAVMVLLSTASMAQAQSFTVGVENIDYYPLYAGADGEYKGYARDLLDAFAKSKGYTFTYTALPINRLFKSFVDGELDFKFPDNPYWSADVRKGKTIVYSESVNAYIDGVLVTPEHKGMDKSQLKTLGLITGFTPWEYLGDVKAGKITLEENDNYQALLKKTALGRVDGAYSNVAVANYQIGQVLNMTGKLEFDPNLPHTKSDYFLSTIKHPQIIQELNAFMQENKQLVDELQAKYQVNNF